MSEIEQDSDSKKCGNIVIRIILLTFCALGSKKWGNVILRIILLIVAAIALIFIVFVYKAYFNEFSSIKPNDLNITTNVVSDLRAAYGQFGDFFGGTLNPILAFLSFIAILFTISLQVSELQETRNELRQTRSVAEEQKEHFKSEAKKTEILQALQQFEKEYEGLEKFSYVEDGIGINIKKYLDKLAARMKANEQIFFHPNPDIKYENILISKNCGNILMEIDQLIGEYEAVSRYEGNAPLKRYYRSKFCNHAMVFAAWHPLGNFYFRHLT